MLGSCLGPVRLGSASGPSALGPPWVRLGPRVRLGSALGRADLGPPWVRLGSDLGPTWVRLGQELVLLLLLLLTIPCIIVTLQWRGPRVTFEFRPILATFSCRATPVENVETIVF